jgi:FdhD protein
LEKIFKVQIKKVFPDHFEDTEDMVVNESPLFIFLNNTKVGTVFRMPGEDTALSYGFLFSNFLIKPSEIKTFNLKENETYFTTDRIFKNIEPIVIYSSCFDEKGSNAINPIESSLTIGREEVEKAKEAFKDVNTVFSETGSTHYAALFEGSHLLYFYEDVGRHNAVMKVIGKMILDSKIGDDKFLLLSGRVSSEIVRVAAISRIPMIISKGAPTSLSIALAKEYKISIIGFLRGERFNIYTFPERIKL